MVISQRFALLKISLSVFRELVSVSEGPSAEMAVRDWTVMSI